MRSLFLCISIAMTAAPGMGCDERIAPGDIIPTEALELWCGSALCDWNVVRGTVVPTATWDDIDTGVALDVDTAIEQNARRSSESRCWAFDLLAKVEVAGDVQFKVDVFGDGVIEHTFDVPAGTWTPATFAFAVDAGYRAMRFEIATSGRGPGIIARMRARPMYEHCEDAVVLDGGPAPLGALCRSDAECATSHCASLRYQFFDACSACDPENPTCPSGQICGLGDVGPDQQTFAAACVDPGHRLLAEQCSADAECASGMCVDGVCSSCRSAADCGGGDCSRGDIREPSRCLPGQRLGQPAAPCYLDPDCASGRCRGLIQRQCGDGRACMFDTDCPEDSRRNGGECRTVGIHGGVCD
jgi:hypothetical protein